MVDVQFRIAFLCAFFDNLGHVQRALRPRRVRYVRRHVT
jgi:hypothetical protein